ncbi:MAG: hypothetical protein MI924_29305 [Chloroflexales bacterium]|nr:hypothetical protein [Chloroflexales bacterium]
MSLSFPTACLPIARGGLPHNSPPQAVGVLLKMMPALVTWPKLPHRSFREQSYVQSAIGFPGLVIDNSIKRAYVQQTIAKREIDRLALAYLRDEVSYGALTSEEAAGLTELLRSIKSGFKGRAIKGQLVGPISLALQLTDEQQRPLVYDPMLLEALAQHLALRAAWQTAQLAAHAKDIIICLDEPFLDIFKSPFCPLNWEFALDLLEQVFAGIKGCRGLATSGAVDWTAVFQSSVDLIILDAYYHSTALLESSAALQAFLERSGIIAWGLIPADEDLLKQETPSMLLNRFDRLLDEFEEAGIERNQILKASLISTNDNLDHLPIPVAEQALQTCAEVSERLRAAYKLPLLEETRTTIT